jgi:chemotaxis protein CheY-P-specific phosphatase CheC
MDLKEMHVSVRERVPIAAEQVELIGGLFRQGLARAARSLSEMVGEDVAAVDGRIEVLPLAQALALVGPAERATVGVHVGLNGQIDAHVVLLFTPAEARRLVDLMLQRIGGGTERFDELARPALAECGNVMGSSFAIVLGDRTGSPLWSTPPSVRVDMAQALVDGLIATAIDERSEVLVGVTSFAQVNAEPRTPVRGTFLFVPEPDGLTTLLEALERPQ